MSWMFDSLRKIFFFDCFYVAGVLFWQWICSTCVDHVSSFKFEVFRSENILIIIFLSVSLNFSLMWDPARFTLHDQHRYIKSTCGAFLPVNSVLKPLLSSPFMFVAPAGAAFYHQTSPFPLFPLKLFVFVSDWPKAKCDVMSWRHILIIHLK